MSTHLSLPSHTLHHFALLAVLSPFLRIILCYTLDVAGGYENDPIIIGSANNFMHPVEAPTGAVADDEGEEMQCHYTDVIWER
jgi:predicted NodU family carbamoyl transferase